MRLPAIFGVLLVLGCGGNDAASGRDGGGGDDGGSGDIDAGDGDDPVAPSASLPERLSTFEITVPEGVKAGVSSWRVWGSRNLAVSRVYTAPLANCETLVCFTTGSGDSITPRIARISGAGTLVQVHDLTAGLECRGLAAEPDGHYAALL
ncbi:MAG: hypothetical protein KJO07_09840, partial [Deltaproteobacteria bacterium]|nr:hypothetical protein [Deltaproteobacteria bacterium]